MPPTSPPTKRKHLHLTFAICLLLLGGALLALVLLSLLHAGLAKLASFDAEVFSIVHAWTSPLLTRGMLALSKIGAIEYFSSALSVVIILLLSQKRVHPAIVLSGTILGAFVLNETLKLHFHRARPLPPWALAHEVTFSFPSGHALFATAFYGALAYLALLKKPGLRRRFEVLVPAIFLPLAIGLSRIYLGVHYPSDVLAGYLAGGAWLTGVIAADRFWRSHAARRS